MGITFGNGVFNIHILMFDLNSTDVIVIYSFLLSMKVINYILQLLFFLSDTGTFQLSARTDPTGLLRDLFNFYMINSL